MPGTIPLERQAIRAAVGSVQFRTQALIDGRFVPAASGKTYGSVNVVIA